MRNSDVTSRQRAEESKQQQRAYEKLMKELNRDAARERSRAKKKKEQQEKQKANDEKQKRLAKEQRQEKEKKEAEARAAELERRRQQSQRDRKARERQLKEHDRQLQVEAQENHRAIESLMSMLVRDTDGIEFASMSIDAYVINVKEKLSAAIEKASQLTTNSAASALKKDLQKIRDHLNKPRDIQTVFLIQQAQHYNYRLTRGLSLINQQRVAQINNVPHRTQLVYIRDLLKEQNICVKIKREVLINYLAVWSTRSKNHLIETVDDKSEREVKTMLKKAHRRNASLKDKLLFSDGRLDELTQVIFGPKWWQNSPRSTKESRFFQRRLDSSNHSLVAEAELSPRSLESGSLFTQQSPRASGFKKGWRNQRLSQRSPTSSDAATWPRNQTPGHSPSAIHANAWSPK